MTIDINSLLIGMILGFSLCLLIVGRLDPHPGKPRRTRRTRKPRS